jgi:membrane protein implicated in regulation of membrane protease activity
MLQRGLFCAAAAVMVCAIGAALLQLAVMILSFSSPVAITVITLMTVVLLNSLRRRIRATRHRFGPRSPRNSHSIHR